MNWIHLHVHANQAYQLVLALVLGVECWLGRTDKLKASSLLELAFIAGVGLMTAIITKKEKSNVS